MNFHAGFIWLTFWEKKKMAASGKQASLDGLYRVTAVRNLNNQHELIPPAVITWQATSEKFILWADVQIENLKSNWIVLVAGNL